MLFSYEKKNENRFGVIRTKTTEVEMNLHNFEDIARYKCHFKINMFQPSTVRLVIQQKWFKACIDFELSNKEKNSIRQNEERDSV